MAYSYITRRVSAGDPSGLKIVADPSFTSLAANVNLGLSSDFQDVGKFIVKDDNFLYTAAFNPTNAIIVKLNKQTLAVEALANVGTVNSFGSNGGVKIQSNVIYYISYSNTNNLRTYHANNLAFISNVSIPFIFINDPIRAEFSENYMFLRQLNYSESPRLVVLHRNNAAFYTNITIPYQAEIVGSTNNKIYISAGSGSNVIFYDKNTAANLGNINFNRPNSQVTEHNGYLYAYTHDNGIIKKYHEGNLAYVSEINLGSARPVGLSFNGNVAYVYSSSIGIQAYAMVNETFQDLGIIYTIPNFSSRGQPFVNIITDNNYLYAKGLSSNQNFSMFSLLTNSTGVSINNITYGRIE
jgi:hypothetical protein